MPARDRPVDSLWGSGALLYALLPLEGWGKRVETKLVPEPCDLTMDVGDLCKQTVEIALSYKFGLHEFGSLPFDSHNVGAVRGRTCGPKPMHERVAFSSGVVNAREQERKPLLSLGVGELDGRKNAQPVGDRRTRNAFADEVHSAGIAVHQKSEEIAFQPFNKSPTVDNGSESFDKPHMIFGQRARSHD
jgi:hypothetical protein